MDEIARENRGYLALKTDFLQLEKCLQRMEKPKEPESVGVEIEQSFKEVLKAVQVSWGRMGTGAEVLSVPGMRPSGKREKVEHYCGYIFAKC